MTLGQRIGNSQILDDPIKFRGVGKIIQRSARVQVRVDEPLILRRWRLVSEAKRG